MAQARRCDGCGKFYEARPEEIFKDENGFIVNAVRIGHWDNRIKQWKSIASGYDLCKECAKKIYDAVCGENSEIKMHAKNISKNFPHENQTADNPSLHNVREKKEDEDGES